MPIRRWTDTLSKGECDELYWNLASLIADRICDESLRQEITVDISRRDYLAICSRAPLYGTTSTSDSIHLRQITALFQKRGDVETELDKRVEAMKKFAEAEYLCRETNEIFSLRSRGVFQFPPDVEHVLHHALRKISQILGDVPPIDTLPLRFGSGALATLPKKDAHAYGKLYHELSCSEDLVPILGDLLAEIPHLVFTPEELEAESVEAKRVDVAIVTARLDFVPKNFKTDRSIAVEPMLNSFLQLGIGDFMASRLRRFGFDTRDQTRNQRLARKGSITGGLATLDLSSASDTVSYGLVLDLLPIDWVELLDCARTSTIEFEGRYCRLEKFSSMGNGFTFPLETLIFAALALSSCKVLGVDATDVAVYGDDIIVPVEVYPLLTRVLRCCGFVPNKDKSFASGPFRESCGQDYLSGINIRPCYVKDGALGCQLFVLHNFFFRNYDRECADLIRSFISEEAALYGPDGFGDGHLLGDFEPVPYGRELGYAGFLFETNVLRGSRKTAKLPGDYRFPLYSVYLSNGRGDSPPLSRSDGSIRFSTSRSSPRNAPYDRIKIYTLTSAP